MDVIVSSPRVRDLGREAVGGDNSAGLVPFTPMSERPLLLRLWLLVFSLDEPLEEFWDRIVVLLDRERAWSLFFAAFLSAPSSWYRADMKRV